MTGSKMKTSVPDVIEMSPADDVTAGPMVSRVPLDRVMLPFAITVLMSRFDGFDKSLEEASLDLGENGWMTFWRITFPLALPGIISSLLLTFIVSFDEFLIAYFLAGNEATLPIYIWGQLRFPYKLPAVLALGGLCSISLSNS